MKKFLRQSSKGFRIIFFVSLTFQTSCVISEYGKKTRDALVKGTSYVGQKSKSAYSATKAKLGFNDSKPSTLKPMSVAKSKLD